MDAQRHGQIKHYEIKSKQSPECRRQKDPDGQGRLAILQPACDRVQTWRMLVPTPCFKNGDQQNGEVNRIQTLKWLFPAICCLQQNTCTQRWRKSARKPW